jgi:aryl-alcohol dehydrogenase-like predicted oxidoreductase
MTTYALGDTLSIPRIGFGAMRLPADRDAAVALARRAVELGANHLDTAAFYRSANAVLREALHPYPADVTIATKVGPIFDGPPRQATPDQLRALVEENLTELGVDVLDLVYLRVGRGAPDPDDSIGERFSVLAALRDEGLIRELGISNVTTEQLAEACGIAPVAAVQNQFGVLDQADAALVEECADIGVAFMPFFALGGGQAELGTHDLTKIAERVGATVHQVALAWGLARSPSIVQIPGTSSLDHLAENVAAGSLQLDAGDLALLTQA